MNKDYQLYIEIYFVSDMHILPKLNEHIYIYVYVFVYICICMYICMCVCVCVCVCVLQFLVSAFSEYQMKSHQLYSIGRSTPVGITTHLSESPLSVIFVYHNTILKVHFQFYLYISLHNCFIVQFQQHL